MPNLTTKQILPGSFLLLVLIVFTLVLVSCEKEKCFYSAGQSETQILITDTFSHIAVWGLFDIELVQDSAYFVEGVAGKNIISHIDAKMLEDTLNLYNHNSCFWLRDYKRPLIRIHFTDIRHIDVHETAFIYSTDSIGDNFSIFFRGGMGETNLILNNQMLFVVPYGTTGGKYVFRGKTQQLSLNNPYTCTVDASQLQAVNVNIDQKSISDARVWAIEKLTVKILNRGNIYYKGNPEIIIDSLSSTGKLINSN